MPKVSIIVPAYNAEKTLAACLGNLVHQTLPDIEIILVNDCSTDNTLSIMMDCETQFPEKIIVVNSDKNRGAGGARNVGLCYASGEYIGFVDSDDIVVPQMYEKLYQKAIDGDYDIVDCGYYNEATDSAMVHTSDELCGTLNDWKRSELIASGGYFWSRIFKKSFFDGLNIRFRENCILEDCETLMLTFAKAYNIGNVKEILYCYKNYDDSISKYTDAGSYFRNASAAIEAVYNTLSVLPDYKGIQSAVEYAIVNFCVFIANSCLINSEDIPEFIKKDRLKKVSEYLQSMVKLPFADNKYIKNKISPEDLNTIIKLMH